MKYIHATNSVTLHPQSRHTVLQRLHLIISNHKCYTRLPKLVKLRNHAPHCLFALRFHMMMLILQHRAVTIGAFSEQKSCMFFCPYYPVQDNQVVCTKPVTVG